MLMLPMSMMGYASFASILTLWGAPYFTDVHDLNLISRGTILMFMSIFWIIGSYVYGKSYKIVKSRKLPILIGSSSLVLILLILSLTKNLN